MDNTIYCTRPHRTENSATQEKQVDTPVWVDHGSVGALKPDYDCVHMFVVYSIHSGLLLIIITLHHQ